MAISPETLTKPQPELPDVEQLAYPSPPQLFELMVEAIKAKANDRDYSGLDSSPAALELEREQSRWIWTAQAGYKLEVLSLAMLALANSAAPRYVSDVSREEGYVTGLTQDKTFREHMELHRLMLREGIKPRDFQWQREMSDNARAVFRAVVNQEETGEILRLDYGEIDLEAAVEELNSWHLLDMQAEGLRLRQFVGDHSWWGDMSVYDTTPNLWLKKNK